MFLKVNKVSDEDAENVFLDWECSELLVRCFKMLLPYVCVFFFLLYGTVPSVCDF